MKTINRYVIGELLRTFIFSLIVITPVLLVSFVVQYLLTKNIPLRTIIDIIPYVVVETSRISLPVSLLLAVTTFFSRMSGANEVVALKSLGIAPWRYLWPVMVLGSLVSLLSVWLNDLAVTWGHHGINAVVYRAAEEIILNELKTKHTFSSSEVTIVVKGVDESKRLLSPSISIKEPPSTIEARYARLNIDFVQSELTVEFSDMKAGSAGNVRYSTDSRKISIPLDKMLPPETVKRASGTGLRDIPSVIAEYEEMSAGVRRQIAAQQAFVCILGSVDEWAIPDWGRWHRRLKNHQESIERYEVEPPRRWASGFCCLFFIWLGAPLAIWMKKTDIFASFFACFIPILLFYYPLFELGLQWAKRGTMPSGTVWIANLGVAAVGYWFWRRVHRY